MKKTCFDNQFEIYLFLDNQTLEAPSKLNEFIAFLKSNKATFPYKFSFVGQNPTLISDLSINQNILIDFNADSLTESKDGQFNEYLKEIDNFYLNELYARLDIPSEMPDMANSQIRKLTSLIKSLLKDGDFIFLESPEDHLSTECLEIFVCALKKQIVSKKQNVFIYSKNVDFWQGHANRIVTRNEDYSFNCKVLTNSKLDVSAHEKFYQNSEVISDILNFNIPAKKDSSLKDLSFKTPKIKIA